jgi:Tol biopolymer transport system component
LINNNLMGGKYIAALLASFLLITMETAQSQICSKTVAPKPLTAGLNLLQISPDSQWALYSTGENEENNDQLTEVYSINLETGRSKKISLPIANGRRIKEAVFSPDSADIVYVVSDQENTGSCEAASEFYDFDSCNYPLDFFRVPAGGGEAVHINRSLNIRLGELTSNFTFTRDSASLYFWTSSNILTYSMASDTFEEIASELPYKRNARLSGDEKWLVFESGNETRTSQSLFTYDIENDVVTQVSKPLLQDARGLKMFTVDPSSTYTYYVGDFDAPADYGVYKVPLSGGASTKVSGDLDLFTNPSAPRLSFFMHGFGGVPSHLYFNTVDSGEDSLYRLGVDSTTPELVTDKVIGAMKFSPNGQFGVGFRRELGVGELQKIPFVGVDDVSYIFPEIKPFSRFLNWEISPDSSEIIFIAQNGSSSSSRALFRIPVNGGSVSRMTAEGVGEFSFSADGKSVFVSSTDAASNSDKLEQISLADGSSVRVDKQIFATQRIFEYQSSNDSQFVISKITHWQITDRQPPRLQIKKLGVCEAESTMCFPVLGKSGRVAQICL